MQIVRQSLFFEAPERVSVRQEALPPLPPEQVLVEAEFSAISAGTELLFYRGQVPPYLPVDETIESLKGAFGYPLKYGYAMVGRVSQVGEAVSRDWQGRAVFAFHPHESHFQVHPQALICIPPSVSAEEALFLPNMETAVNLVMDGAPRLGERVAVVGQGVVGLLTTALLSAFPLSELTTFEPISFRRQLSLQMGAHRSVAPPVLAGDIPVTEFSGRYDLVFEVSGSPAALNLAILLCGFDGRIVVGSWYGTKKTALDLGGYFHRRRLRLVSSQVSTIAPELSGRWNKERRFEVSWEMIRRIKPAILITHRFELSQAAEAFRLLAEGKEEGVLQVVFCYR
ncbi:MAG: zinc-binding alcohol dehydrogenase [Anaerolineales bacterium]|nr:zinc-binding alcohol dehydrogenase [Anaerolineales bacterium]MCS7248187.1 zinc-binding alcohol dehydrogenase [Anaerolineales bacterium]MDW8162000.1 zinc-binding alcohol dehydrogenase [Anaerolineales bacterium]MDW8446167.1 zinc-binding alcohol dehydrogenase [Anaerolineales bacterium]